MYIKPDMILPCVEGVKQENGNLLKVVHFGPYLDGRHSVVINDIEVTSYYLRATNF